MPREIREKHEAESWTSMVARRGDREGEQAHAHRSIPVAELEERTREPGQVSTVPPSRRGGTRQWSPMILEQL